MPAFHPSKHPGAPAGAPQPCSSCEHPRSDDEKVPQTIVSLVAPPLLLWSAVAAAHAATITVNPGQSIQTAVNQAKAGDVVLVKAGTYNQKVLFNGRSGAAGAFITLRGEAGAIVDGTGVATSGREGLVTIRNSNYVQVENLTVTGLITDDHERTPVGILVEGSGSNIQIVGNDIHHIQHTSTCAESDSCLVGAHGLAVFGTSSAGITDVRIENNRVHDNVLQASEALVVNGNVNRFEVLFNDVYDNNNIGYDFIGYEGECGGCGENDRVRNGIVRGNRAANNSTTTNPWYNFDGSAAGFYVDGGRYIVFERNVSTRNDIGFEFASEHPGKATEDILMTNNFVVLNRDAGLSLGGYESDLGAARRIKVNNNSFYKNKGFGSEITLQYKVIDSSFNNNVIFGASTIAESYIASPGGSSGNTWGRNLWWAPSTSSSRGIPGTTVFQDPRYVAPDQGNLRLQGTSPAINQGSLGAALTGWSSPLWTSYYSSGSIPANGNRDYDGQQRLEGGTIDLGADEYGTTAGTAR